jgi:hypothetical protein
MPDLAIGLRPLPSPPQDATANPARRVTEPYVIWTLNVRDLTTETKMQELEEEATCGPPGVYSAGNQPEKIAESIVIGNWRMFATGNCDKSRGTGTANVAHLSIQVTSRHDLSPRITAIRIPYEKTDHVILRVRTCV